MSGCCQSPAGSCWESGSDVALGEVALLGMEGGVVFLASSALRVRLGPCTTQWCRLLVLLWLDCVLCLLCPSSERVAVDSVDKP